MSAPLAAPTAIIPLARLTWTGGWRNIYAEHAEQLGFEARAGNNCIEIRRNGKVIGHSTPKKRTFMMQALITELVEKIQLRALTKAFKKNLTSDL